MPELLPCRVDDWLVEVVEMEAFDLFKLLELVKGDPSAMEVGKELEDNLPAGSASSTVSPGWS